MKQLLLVAILSAVASSAMTLLVAGAIRPATPPATAPVVDFKAALADLEREVAAMRREAALRGGADPAPAPSAVPVPGESAAPRPSPVADVPVMRDARSPEAPVSVPDALKRFHEVLPRTDAGERDNDRRTATKKKWLFHDEREVLDWFGLPYLIQAEGEMEVWHYEIPNGNTTPDGDPDDDFWIKINRGRLVDIGD